MAINWSRAKRRLAALERLTRDRISWRLHDDEIADGCVVLRAGLKKAGIDPEHNWALRKFSQAHPPRCSPENSERRNADQAFAAADPVLSRRENFMVKAREHAMRLPRIGPLPLRDTFFEWVAWALLNLGFCDDPAPAPS